MKELFALWSGTVGLAALNESLGESIGELHAYYSDITSRRVARSTDVLAVVLGKQSIVASHNYLNRNHPRHAGSGRVDYQYYRR